MNAALVARTDPTCEERSATLLRTMALSDLIGAA
jgi:hypothetical protein